jgi:hypothetical protein
LRVISIFSDKDAWVLHLKKKVVQYVYAYAQRLYRVVKQSDSIFFKVSYSVNFAYKSTIMALKKLQEKEFAKSLYIGGGITQKEIASRVSVTEKTLANWIKVGKWDSLKKSLLTTKQNQLSFLYDQLEFLNSDISQREYKVAVGKEADTIIKLTAAINRLETETSIGDTVEVARNFIEFVRPQDLELAKTITNLFDVFITAKMK